MSCRNNIKGGQGEPVAPSFLRQFDQTDYTIDDLVFGVASTAYVELREDGTVYEVKAEDFDIPNQIGTWYTGTIPGALADYEVRWQQGGQDPTGPLSDTINNWVSADDGNGHGGGLISIWGQDVFGGQSSADGQLQTRLTAGGLDVQAAQIDINCDSQP
jgi:hypothetical protein